MLALNDSWGVLCCFMKRSLQFFVHINRIKNTTSRGKHHELIDINNAAAQAINEHSRAFTGFCNKFPSLNIFKPRSLPGRHEWNRQLNAFIRRRIAV